MCKTPKMPEAPPAIKPGFFQSVDIQTSDSATPVLDVEGASARGQLQAGGRGKSALAVDTIAKRLSDILGKRTIASSGTEQSRKADKKKMKEESATS